MVVVVAVSAMDQGLMETTVIVPSRENDMLVSAPDIEDLSKERQNSSGRKRCGFATLSYAGFWLI
jgi:hypothetical protein